MLTFRNNQFLFTDKNQIKILDLKAAVGLRRYADDIAEKVLRNVIVKTYPLPPHSLPLNLDPHQIEGVHWILTRSRSYLAHAPGAGKTAEAIVASLLAQGEGRTLFIVPPTLTANWAREILKWTEWQNTFPSVSIVPSTPRQQNISWRSEFIICPDSMLTKPWVLEKLISLPTKFLAVDEASRFKEPTSQRTRALFGGDIGNFTSPGLIHQTRHAVLLDGSPMPNRPMELWAPTYAMAPEAIDFMSQQDFGFRYCGATLTERGQWEFRHSSNEDELKTRLQKSFMHVVPESRLDHPERKRSLLFMTHDPRTKDMRTWERAHLTKLKMSEIDEDLSRGDIAGHRRLLGIRKVPWTAAYVQSRLDTTKESLLVFAWHREVVASLADHLHKYAPLVVMGGTSEMERENGFRDFQSGKRRLIIGNIQAMGRGHNLQRADRIVFSEFSWGNELNIQCEKRASRKGRDAAQSVRCEYVVAPGSMDEVVLNAVFTKEKTVKRVIG